MQFVNMTRTAPGKCLLEFRGDDGEPIVFENVSIPKEAEYGVFVFFRDDKRQIYRLVSRLSLEKEIDILVIPFQTVEEQ